jgi:Zn-dependent M28 family amino/carboxypeptidase
MRKLTLSILVSLAAFGCIEASQRATPTFDGARALQDVRQLVAIGPRVAGTPGAQQARGYIRKQLEATGLAVEEQPFETATPLGRVKMVNVRAVIPASASGSSQPAGRLIIAGHYDTKLFRDFRFVGANDGGSSAAMLIELGRVLKPRANAMPIELLFLDGEEAVVAWEQGNDHTYGSRYYVEAAAKAGALKDIRALVLVDMIGDRDLRILRESHSTPWLTDIIWSAARRLKRPEFVDDATPIEDDHLEFLAAGVPSVDIIDLDYPAWHRPEDTLDKVSAASLQAVGDVLLAALPEIEKRPTGK